MIWIEKLEFRIVGRSLKNFGFKLGPSSSHKIGRPVDDIWNLSFFWLCVLVVCFEMKESEERGRKENRKSMSSRKME